MADDSLFLIDIDKILREKAPKQSKYIPKFVVSYLKHIVHQEELNVFLRESKDKVGVDFLKACLEFLILLCPTIPWVGRMEWHWVMSWAPFMVAR